MIYLSEKKSILCHKIQQTVRNLLRYEFKKHAEYECLHPSSLFPHAHTDKSINGWKYSIDYDTTLSLGESEEDRQKWARILVFINIYFISSNCLTIINIIIFIFVSSQTNLIDRILCPCYYMIQLALISSHFTHFLLTDYTTYWCSLISICNVISQE